MTIMEEKIKQIIKNELKGDFGISNSHGVDLIKCLVEPYLDTFEGSLHPEQHVDLYVVLKEFPDSEEGYQIVYFPKFNKFGLALGRYKEKTGIFLGIYGTFLETLKGM